MKNKSPGESAALIYKTVLAIEGSSEEEAWDAVAEMIVDWTEGQLVNGKQKKIRDAEKEVFQAGSYFVSALNARPRVYVERLRDLTEALIKLTDLQK